MTILSDAEKKDQRDLAAIVALRDDMQIPPENKYYLLCPTGVEFHWPSSFEVADGLGKRILPFFRRRPYIVSLRFTTPVTFSVVYGDVMSLADLSAIIF